MATWEPPSMGENIIWAIPSPSPPSLGNSHLCDTLASSWASHLTPLGLGSLKCKMRALDWTTLRGLSSSTMLCMVLSSLIPSAQAPKSAMSPSGKEHGICWTASPHLCLLSSREGSIGEGRDSALLSRSILKTWTSPAFLTPSYSHWKPNKSTWLPPHPTAHWLDSNEAWPGLCISILHNVRFNLNFVAWTLR